MATDDLTTPGSDAPDPKPTGTPAPALDAASIAAAVREGLAGLPAALQQHSQAIANHLDNRLAGRQGNGAPQSPSQESPSDDPVARFFSDPKTAVQDAIKEWAATNLAPLASVQINDAYENLKDKHRTKIDATYGEGTFDTELLPRMEELLKAMDPKARGSSLHFQSVMKNVMGDDEIMGKLFEKRSAADKRRQDAPTGIITEGRSAPAQTRLSEDSKQWMAEYAEATGTKLDAKELEGILAARRTTGYWTTQNFPGIKNAKLPVPSR